VVRPRQELPAVSLPQWERVENDGSVSGGGGKKVRRVAVFRHRGHNGQRVVVDVVLALHHRRRHLSPPSSDAVHVLVAAFPGRPTRKWQLPAPRITSNHHPIGSIITVNPQGFFLLRSSPPSSGWINAGNYFPEQPAGL
jgi:hypothetical protein